MSDPEDMKNKYTVIILIFFLSGPILMILAFLENKYFISEFVVPYNSVWITIAGFILMIMGGIVLLISRYQLNKKSYGGSNLSGNQEQNLVTDGFYKYIRNPIYTGGLIMTFGINFIIGSLIILVLHVTLYLFIFINRIVIEEKILKKKFGLKYINYMENTCRLIPFLY